MSDLKSQIIQWLKSRTKEDIVYVKRQPELIFLKHPGMSRYDAEKLIEEPDKVFEVKIDKSHGDRLEIIKIYTKISDLTYIILDPFNLNLEQKFKDKVAIVTFFPSKHKQ